MDINPGPSAESIAVSMWRGECMRRRDNGEVVAVDELMSVFGMD